jgi:guanylate kinase
MSMNYSERVVIVSGPSGAGKSTVMREVFRKAPVPMVSSVSATTRKPRPGEADGKAYHFITEEEFQRRRQNGDFLECFEVFDKGHWYGTLWSEVTAAFEAKKWAVLEIDVQGAMLVLNRFPAAISIFIRPSSFAELERRVRDRGTECEEEIQCRLHEANKELACISKYKYQVINDQVDDAVNDICNILTQEWEKVQND